MIEVNLLPGGKKRGAGGGFSLGAVTSAFRGLTSGRGGGGGSSMDPYIGFFGVAAALALGFMGWSFMSVRSEAEELDVQVEAAVQDSIRNAAVIQRTNALRARGDSIQRRVAIIQEIDADRYTWSHILDEIAVAVPEYTWLREILYLGENPLQVRVAGRAGSIFVITNFMRRLESSRFIRAVITETIQEIPSEENPEDLVYMFELTMIYSPPPLDELETVPLFGGTTAQAQTDGTGN